jgi:predicted hydrocarbon binding protein
MDNKDIIIGEIQNAVSKLLGTGAAALMRQAGISASAKIWPDLPSGKTPEEAGAIMSEGVKGLGGFGEFSIIGVEDGVVKIQFKQCFFAGLSKESGQPVGHQPICHFGFGLVEETFKRLTGIVTKVELAQRDDGCATCFETATPR